MKKVLFITIFLFGYLSFYGQITNANWKAHFAYSDFVDVVVSENNIYIAALNSVFIHNTISNSNTEFTSIDGLSGENITAIDYIEDQSAIAIGYESGLIEIVNEITGNVTKLVDVGNQSAFPVASIKINHFFQDGDILYIATGFGIVEYNLNSGFFGDTFLISDTSDVVSDVLAVGVIGETILASISGRGVFMADKNDLNLITESSWTNIQADVFVDIQSFSGMLIAHKKTTEVFTYDNSLFSSVYTSDNSIIDFEVNSNNELTLSHATGSSVINVNFEEKLNIEHLAASELNSNVDISVYLNNEIYFSNSKRGFFRTTDLNFESIIKISPDGPELKDAYALDAFDGDLWVTYGSTNVSFNDGEPDGVRSNGVDRLRNGQWLNIPFESFNAKSIEDVVIDQQNKEVVYFSSYNQGGLLKYDNGNLTLYNEQNSNIEKDGQRFLVPSFDFSRVYSSGFDANGELWIVNSRQKNTLKKFSTVINSSDNIDFELFINKPTNRYDYYSFQEFVFDELGNVYIASFKNGVIGYSTTSSVFRQISDEDSHNMPSGNAKALIIDKNGELWIGTTRGLRRLSDPSSLLRFNTVEAESIIFLDEGIAQELLFDQSITDIKVDASNNKWISTANGGVFYVSPDGQETIYNFTTENSPLPSNTVNDMALDDSTGAVFFATNNGLMEFNSSITSAEEDLTKLKVFPNPVRPEYENPTVTIQGLTAGANVKITDIEGNLVYEIQNETFESGGSGSVLWDTKSFSGKTVSSGVYLILITDADGVETSAEKLLIVR